MLSDKLKPKPKSYQSADIGRTEMLSMTERTSSPVKHGDRNIML